jgi:bifunctional enzyme CysN/CysC
MALERTLVVTTAGSVDDGKSTVLARLLFDSGAIYQDQISSSFDENRIADLIDGLESERQQGITIDVAHRFLDYGATRFHFKDAPGHEQYTRNMATAAAGSDVVVLLVDAREGVKPQTMNHLDVALLVGVRRFVVLVTKMDLVKYSQKIFQERMREFSEYASKHSLANNGQAEITILPVSGLKGENVRRRSSKLSWFDGPTLLDSLMDLGARTKARKSSTSVLEVQYIIRKPGGGRSYFGQVLSGTFRDGDAIFANGVLNKLKLAHSSSSDVSLALEGDSIAFSLETDVDLQVGALLSDRKVESYSTYSGTLIWFSKDPGIKSRSYLSIVGSRSNRLTLTKIEEYSPRTDLKAGEIRSVPMNAVTKAEFVFENGVEDFSEEDSANLMRGVLVDQFSGETAGAFVLDFPLRRSKNVVEHDFAVSRNDREELSGTKGKVLWFTGLSGSGKSTVADRVSVKLLESHVASVNLDGDSLRHGLNQDLGFTESDRSENIRRSAEVSKLFAEAGLIAIVSLVSPTVGDRQNAKNIVGAEDFIEIFVDTPLKVCEARDPKGLYKKARLGEIPNFTGITAPFDRPENPDIYLDGTLPVDDLAEQVLKFLTI